MKLIETKDTKLLASFMKGDGIIRRCSGGFDLGANESNMENFIKDSPARFLVVYDDDGSGKGFIAMNKEWAGVFSIHLCLKTIGAKTRQAFKLAVEWSEAEGAKAILAAYPISNRAVTKLLDEFGFHDSEPFFEPPVPYHFKRLSL